VEGYAPFLPIWARKAMESMSICTKAVDMCKKKRPFFCPTVWCILATSPTYLCSSAPCKQLCFTMRSTDQAHFLALISAWKFELICKFFHGFRHLQVLSIYRKNTRYSRPIRAEAIITNSNYSSLHKIMFNEFP
jgi:hypothetical protein